MVAGVAASYRGDARAPPKLSSLGAEGPEDRRRPRRHHRSRTVADGRRRSVSRSRTLRCCECGPPAFSGQKQYTQSTVCTRVIRDVSGKNRDRQSSSGPWTTRFRFDFNFFFLALRTRRPAERSRGRRPPLDLRRAGDVRACNRGHRTAAVVESSSVRSPVSRTTIGRIRGRHRSQIADHLVSKPG